MCGSLGKTHSEFLTFFIRSENYRLSWTMTYSMFLLHVSQSQVKVLKGKGRDLHLMISFWLQCRSIVDILTPSVWLQTELSELNRLSLWHLAITAWAKGDIHCVWKSLFAIKILDIFRQADCFYHHVVKFAHYPTCNKQEDIISKIRNSTKIFPHNFS